MLSDGAAMKPEYMAEVLQDLLCDAMDAWAARTQLDPMRKLPWDRLDPISKMLYIERCGAFLKRFDVIPKGVN